MSSEYLAVDLNADQGTKDGGEKVKGDMGSDKKKVWYLTK